MSETADELRARLAQFRRTPGPITIQQEDRDAIDGMLTRLTAAEAVVNIARLARNSGGVDGRSRLARAIDQYDEALALRDPS